MARGALLICLYLLFIVESTLTKSIPGAANDDPCYKTDENGQRVKDPECNKCEKGYWRAGNECLPCECDSVGSTSNQCNEMGQCPCRERSVTGRKCDRDNSNYKRT
ncbi:laminin subunit gamma-3 [Ditylenchus destructor]|uniref:Laminin subunit gamma-3 n=1 Tax=Ditylenchus destructor TaxID=166010 RepID=A0AAD4QVN8_9BILA|nr:laminin subunit gamma-3 [Ditylenchus destructor]